MECNKDEARRAMDIAEKKLSVNDYLGAKKFVNKAQNLYPKLDGLEQALMMIDVYITAGNKISGGEADWYGIFGVDPLADDETVKKQYKKLALLLHPDKNKLKGAEEAFKLVSEAWSLLSNKAKRIAYDQKRKSKTGMQKPPASTNGNQNASGGAGNTKKAGGGMQNLPNPNKPASTNGNQNASVNPSGGVRTRSTSNAAGVMQGPVTPPKPASNNGNHNASVNPSGGARTRSTSNAASGMQKPPIPPKPASNNGNRNASVNPSVVARRTNKPAGGMERLATHPKPVSINGNRNVAPSGGARSINHTGAMPRPPTSSGGNQNARNGLVPSAKATSNKPARVPAPVPPPQQQWGAQNQATINNVSSHQQRSAQSSSYATYSQSNSSYTFSARWNYSFSVTSSSSYTVNAVNQTQQCQKRGHEEMVGRPNLVASAATNEVARPLKKPMVTKTPNPTLAGRPSPRQVTARTSNSTLDAVKPSSRPVTTLLLKQ